MLNYHIHRKHCQHFALVHPTDEILKLRKEYLDFNQTMQKYLCRFCPRLHFELGDGILGDT